MPRATPQKPVVAAPATTPDDAAIDDTADFHPLYLPPTDIQMPAGTLPLVRPLTMGGLPAEVADTPKKKRRA